MLNMWDERYAQDEYVYGKEPNTFFKEQIETLKPGRILLPAEGEGRNSVFAATLGWQVVAFDSSTEARKKALYLAEEKNVKIEYRLLSYEQAAYEANSFDAIAFIYAHLIERRKFYQILLKSLKPGGIVVLEGFSKKQIENHSGGPQNINLLFSKEELITDFSSLSEVNAWEEELTLQEGKFHSGQASVIRLIGKK